MGHKKFGVVLRQVLEVLRILEGATKCFHPLKKRGGGGVLPSLGGGGGHKKFLPAISLLFL